MLLLYAIALHFVAVPSRIKLQSQWQENRHVVEKYFHSPHQPATIYAGSSLTKRLDFGNSSSCAYNLALDGESTLTGLSAVQKSSHIPKMVFVEINVPERDANQGLVDHASGLLLQLSPMFYTENIPTNFVYSVLASLRQPKPFVLVIDESIRQSELSRHMESYKHPLDPAVLQRSMDQYRTIISRLENKGTAVVLFEMPVHASLEKMTRPVQVRTAFQRTFPSNQFLRFEELTGGVDLQTMDGIHLGPGEAKTVAAGLSRYGKC